MSAPRPTVPDAPASGHMDAGPGPMRPPVVASGHQDIPAEGWHPLLSNPAGATKSPAPPPR